MAEKRDVWGRLALELSKEHSRRKIPGHAPELFRFCGAGFSGGLFQESEARDAP